MQGSVVCVFKDMDQCVGDVEFQLKGDRENVGKRSVWLVSFWLNCNGKIVWIEKKKTNEGLGISALICYLDDKCINLTQDSLFLFLYQKSGLVDV